MWWSTRTSSRPTSSNRDRRNARNWGCTMASKKILVVASNYGVWAEELQAPWDILREAGHQLTLATYKGKTPLPLKISVQPEFVDPIQDVKVNPPEVCRRVEQILASGEWSRPIKLADARMADY